MQWIKKAWRGEEKLWKVFWIYGVLGYFILWVLSSVVVTGAVMTSVFGHGIGSSDKAITSGMDLMSKELPSALLIQLLMKAAFLMSSWILIWRCAFNTDRKFWTYAARIWVILGIIVYAFIFYNFSSTQKIMRNVYGAMPRCSKMMDEKAHVLKMDESEYLKKHEEELKDCLRKAAQSNENTP